MDCAESIAEVKRLDLVTPKTEIDGIERVVPLGKREVPTWAEFKTNKLIPRRDPPSAEDEDEG